MTTTQHITYSWIARNHIGEPLPIVNYTRSPLADHAENLAHARNSDLTITEAPLMPRDVFTDREWWLFAKLVVLAFTIGLCMIPFVFPVDL